MNLNNKATQRADLIKKLLRLGCALRRFALLLAASDESQHQLSILENDGKKIKTGEAKLIKSILNKIAKHQKLPTAHHD